MAKSVAHERKTTFYPEPKYLKRLNEYCERTGEGKSSVAKQALKEFFDRREANRLLASI